MLTSLISLLVSLSALLSGLSSQLDKLVDLPKIYQLAQVPNSQPTTQPLLQANNLTYLGAFRLPITNTGGNYGFDYADAGGIAFNPANNSLFITNHVYENKFAEINIPVIINSNNLDSLNRSVQIQNLADVTEGNMSKFGLNGSVVPNPSLGGSLVYGNKLIGTVYDAFDAGSNAKLSHYTHSLTTTETGTFRGMFKVGSLNAGFYGGYMASVPAEWQPLLGGPAITGQCCISIITRTSFGPSAFIFDPNDLGEVDPVPAIPLLYYPASNTTLGGWSSTDPISVNLNYNMSSQVGGVVFPTGTRTVLFFGYQGTGLPHYGNATSDPKLDGLPDGTGQSYVYDPDGRSKIHAYPHKNWVWAYDANDLLAVRNGQKNPWEVKPYAVWELNLPSGVNSGILGAAYDSYTQRIYLKIKGRDTWGTPSIEVYEVNNSIPVARAVGAISATPYLKVGSSGFLSWSSSQASSVSIDNGIGTVATSGTIIISPTKTTTYNLTVSNANGSASYQTKVLVESTENSIHTPAPVITISALPSSIASGSSSGLNWSATDATTCVASGGWSGVKGISGVQTVSPTTNTTYTLTCTGPGGSSIQSVVVSVSTPMIIQEIVKPTLSLSLTPSSITTGSFSTISWSSNNSNSCAASGGWVGEKSISGSLVITPTTNSTYVLTCTGPGGFVDQSVSVVVTTPTQTIGSTNQPVNPVTTNTFGAQSSRMVQNVLRKSKEWVDSNPSSSCYQLNFTQAEVGDCFRYFFNKDSFDWVAIDPLVSTTSSSVSIVPVVSTSSLTTTRRTLDRNLRYGMKNDSDVTLLQQILTKEGIYSGPITGNFFNQTLIAVKKFQSKYGISATGFVGILTRIKLREI